MSLTRWNTDEKGRRHGHLLAQGQEHHNLMPELRGPAGAVDLVRSRGIKWWRKARSGDVPGVDRPTRNLASSQIACVNFLLPLVVGRTAEGLRAFVFEWKYCEEYLRPSDKGVGSSGDTRRRRCQARYAAPDSSFRGDVPLDDFRFEPFYQIMRLRLLADEMQRGGLTPSLLVTDARVVVACPAANHD